MKEKTKKANTTTAMGVLQIAGGSVAILVTGILNLLGSWLLAWGNMLFAVGAIAGGLLILGGYLNCKFASGVRKVAKTIGDNPSISLINLERRLCWTRKKLLKTLRKQIKKGYWPGCYIDMTSETFIVDYTPAVTITETGNEVLDGQLGDANTMLGEMSRAVHQIEDPELKSRVETLSNIAGQIYAHVSKHPDKAHLVRQLSNYFLPTTVGLLRKYIDMQNQSVKTASVTEAMDKIKAVMATLEEVYKNQFDALMSDKMLDVDVEIEVLQNMAGM